MTVNRGDPLVHPDPSKRAGIAAGEKGMCPGRRGEGAGPHLCHDISICHIQVILIQFAKEVSGGDDQGPVERTPIL